jgi:hypothetical protein
MVQLRAYRGARGTHRVTTLRVPLCQRQQGADSGHRLPTGVRLFATQTGYDRLGLFNYLVGAGEDRRRDSQAERPRGFGVDDEFECGRLLNRKISRLSSLQDAVDIASGAAASSRHGELAAAADRRQPRGGDVGRLRCEKRFIVDDERIRHGLRDRRDVLFVTDAAHHLCARLLETLD